MTDDPLSSAEWNEIAAALAKAQGAMENAEKDASNPHFRSKYATIAAVRSATVPHLSANGIAIVQQICLYGDNLLIKTMLIHSSGQWLASEFPIPPLGRVQEIGSYITYARRYSWMSLVGIAAEDDDGNTANETDTLKDRKPQPPPANPMKDTAANPQSRSSAADPGGTSQGSARVQYIADRAELEAVLRSAADRGTESLEAAWHMLNADNRRHFKTLLDKHLKPIARGVDEDRQADEAIVEDSVAE